MSVVHYLSQLSSHPVRCCVIGLCNGVGSIALSMPADADSVRYPGSRDQPRRRYAGRILLTAAMTLAALNIWTGGPLLALWIGSQFQGEGPPEMSSVAIVVVSLAAICLALVRVLTLLSDRHDRLTGRTATVRAHAPWLRSMRGERPLYPGMKPRTTTLERILVLMVVAACLAFEIWFFFFSTSPIDGRSGRSQTFPGGSVTHVAKAPTPAPLSSATATRPAPESRAHLVG
jgi:hypothetical protein